MGSKASFEKVLQDFNQSKGRSIRTPRGAKNFTSRGKKEMLPCCLLPTRILYISVFCPTPTSLDLLPLYGPLFPFSLPKGFLGRICI